MSEQNAVDARTLRCPEPMMLTRKQMRRVENGTELTILSDDPRTPHDLKAFCTMMDHTFVSQETIEDKNYDNGSYTVTVLRKGL